MSDAINHDRRRFFGTAAMTIAAAQLGMAALRTHNPSLGLAQGEPKYDDLEKRLPQLPSSPCPPVLFAGTALLLSSQQTI